MILFVFCSVGFDRVAAKDRKPPHIVFIFSKVPILIMMDPVIRFPRWLLMDQTRPVSVHFLIFFFVSLKGCDFRLPWKPECYGYKFLNKQECIARR